MDSLHDDKQSEIPSTITSAASLRTRLMEIDTEMADLYARLQQLAVARRRVVEALKSIIYPILTLPPEITAEIFKQCVDETITVARAKWLGPLVLSSVCRAWRHIGFNLQSIWSNICIPNTYEAVPSLEKVAWWWLPRVGGHPLDMTGPSPMLKALMKYSMQWRSISCPVDIDNSAFLNPIQGRIPLLRTLEITPSRRLYSGPTPITMFSEAPNLREVTLTAGSTGRVSTFITLPWTQLTSFTYWNQSTAQSLGLLSLTPRLESFSVTQIGARPSSAPLAPVHLAHLHTIKLSGASLPLLNYLALPSLKCLTLDFEQYNHPTLLSFLTQPGSPSLRFISFFAVKTMAHVVSALEASPSVSEVSISTKARDWNPLFSKIRTEPNFLPNLRILSLETQAPRTGEIVEISRMLAARWCCGPEDIGGAVPTPARLDSFRLVYDRVPSNFNPLLDPDAAQVEQCTNTLRTLVKEGCKIQIEGLDWIYFDSVRLLHPWILETC